MTITKNLQAFQLTWWATSQKAKEKTVFLPVFSLWRLLSQSLILANLWQMHQHSSPELWGGSPLLFFTHSSVLRTIAALQLQHARSTRLTWWSLWQAKAHQKGGSIISFSFFNTYWISSCNLRQHFSLMVCLWMRTCSVSGTALLASVLLVLLFLLSVLKIYLQFATHKTPQQRISISRWLAFF